MLCEKIQTAEMVATKPFECESSSLLRLKVELCCRVEQTCEKLKEAFERKLLKEREMLDEAWRETERRLKSELEASLNSAMASACQKFDEARSKELLLPLKNEKKTKIGVKDSMESLREALSEKDAELEMAYCTYFPTLEAQRRAQTKLVEAREAALEVAKKHRSDAFGIKVMGVLDPLPLLRAGLQPEEISSLQERLRHPDFHPFKTVMNGSTPLCVPDDHHPEIVALRFDYGQQVVDDVLRCVTELDEWNPSGRYHVAIPWDHDTNTELQPADIIRKISNPPPQSQENNNIRSRNSLAITRQQQQQRGGARTSRGNNNNQAPVLSQVPPPLPARTTRPNNNNNNTWVQRSSRNLFSFAFHRPSETTTTPTTSRAPSENNNTSVLANGPTTNNPAVLTVPGCTN